MSAIAGVRAIVPVLRSFDEGQARDFYLRYLGFSVTFEHRFAPDMPLYMGIALEGAEIQLSEHHGDATPGSAVRIAMTDVAAFHRAIRARGHPRLDPGIEDRPWGEREVAVVDPSGNRLIFCSPLDGAQPR